MKIHTTRMLHSEGAHPTLLCLETALVACAPMRSLAFVGDAGVLAVGRRPGSRG